MAPDPLQHLLVVNPHSSALRVRSTSSQLTGVDTVGRWRARSEYTLTVVF